MNTIWEGVKNDGIAQEQIEEMKQEVTNWRGMSW